MPPNGTWSAEMNCHLHITNVHENYSMLIGLSVQFFESALQCNFCSGNQQQKESKSLSRVKCRKSSVESEMRVNVLGILHICDV
jgi:hypothetical protein